MILNTSSL